MRYGYSFFLPSYHLHHRRRAQNTTWQSKRESRKLNEIICLVSTTYGEKLRQFIAILPGFVCHIHSGIRLWSAEYTSNTHTHTNNSSNSNQTTQFTWMIQRGEAAYFLHIWTHSIRADSTCHDRTKTNNEQFSGGSPVFSSYSVNRCIFDTRVAHSIATCGLVLVLHWFQANLFLSHPVSFLSLSRSLPNSNFVWLFSVVCSFHFIVLSIFLVVLSFNNKNRNNILKKTTSNTKTDRISA